MSERTVDLLRKTEPRTLLKIDVTPEWWIADQGGPRSMAACLALVKAGKVQALKLERHRVVVSVAIAEDDSALAWLAKRLRSAMADAQEES